MNGMSNGGGAAPASYSNGGAKHTLPAGEQNFRMSTEAYRAEHGLVVQGDRVPPPLQTFEAVGFPPTSGTRSCTAPRPKAGGGPPLPPQRRQASLPPALAAGLEAKARCLCEGAAAGNGARSSRGERCSAPPQKHRAPERRGPCCDTLLATPGARRCVP